MDTRADPFVFLGLKPGDAVVIRTGGGAVASSLDYLILLDYLMGSFEDVFVIQHTGEAHSHEEEKGVEEGAFVADR